MAFLAYITPVNEGAIGGIQVLQVVTGFGSVISACLRDTAGSLTTRSLSAKRPKVIVGLAIMIVLPSLGPPSTTKRAWLPVFQGSVNDYHLLGMYWEPSDTFAGLLSYARGHPRGPAPAPNSALILTNNSAPCPENLFCQCVWIRYN